jgi:hypothetical protein
VPSDPPHSWVVVEEKGCPEGDRGRVQVVQVTAPSRTARNTKDTGE